MSKRILWAVVCGLMALSLVMAACGPAATTTTPTTSTPANVTTSTSPTTTSTPAIPVIPTTQTTVKPTAEMPEYGGVITLLATADISGTTVDGYYGNAGTIIKGCVTQTLWGADWAKGIAGGYGTNESDWGEANNDLRDLKTGYVAESWKWTVDSENNQGTIVYQIRQGIHYALDPNFEASRLVNGRELTADDVVFSLKRHISPGADLYNGNPELRTANITKTGPWEVTIKVPIEGMTTGLARFGGQVYMTPPETIAKWGSVSSWKISVGSGAFMTTEYIPGSLITQVRNTNFWMTDPVGPGKGNQLPYLDGIQYLIIPDMSTQQAALRTGKLDQLTYLTREDGINLQKIKPELKAKITVTRQGRGDQTAMRNDIPPFNDIRVRKAMYMATDFNAINKNLHNGLGLINTFPFGYVKEYAELYVALDDPDFPPAGKELYTYNPEKAKQLLKEAGYPNGLKTELLTTTVDVDYYSILIDMWAKAGINVSLMVRESAALNNLLTNKTHPPLAKRITSPIANYVTPNFLRGTDVSNASCINDPKVDAFIKEIQLAAVTDERAAMKKAREMAIYIIPQAFSLSNVVGPNYHLWWPWIKNYSGEMWMGGAIPSWPQFVWMDLALKKSMGY